MKTIVIKWKRISLLVIAFCTLFSASMIAQNNIAYSDVDSIGDIWVITLDKSGSMLKDKTSNPNKPKYVSPSQIADSIMPWLSQKPNLLSLINYDHDKIAIFETGYGTKKEHSYGKIFKDTIGLDQCFMHLFLPPSNFYTNKQDGLEKILLNRIDSKDTSYCYLESFVSQIRVLALSRIVDYLKEHGRTNSFRKIHLIIITDDADENDQWKTDYYSIKFRSNKKHQELNDLTTKYFYNSFTQQGGGIIDEQEDYTKTGLRSKYHIYLYDYKTKQQNTDSTSFVGNSLVDITPMNGTELTFERKCDVLESDTIDFVFIEWISINGKKYQVNKYLIDTLKTAQQYAINALTNKTIVKGQIQVQYIDSIFGHHTRKINFEQESTILSERAFAWQKRVILLLIMCCIIALIYVLIILPYKRIMTIYTSEGKKMCVRRGYKWQWKETVNPVLLSTKQRNTFQPIATIFAKHSCFSSKKMANVTNGKQYYWVIDSPNPLSSSEQIKGINTSMDVMRYVQRDVHCPSLIKDVYTQLALCKIDELTVSQHKWIRSIGRFMQRCYHKICPHYFYWVQVYQANASISIISPSLPDNPFLFELVDAKLQKPGINDPDVSRILYQYYNQFDLPTGDVLISIENDNGNMTWNVFLLQSRLRQGKGISSVKHLLHYTHAIVDDKERDVLCQNLKKAIYKELHVDRIVVFYPNNLEYIIIPFLIEQNVHMNYIYLVEDTIEQKAHQIYSPLTDQLDASNPRKMVSIRKAKYEMELFTSLIPFRNGKEMPQNGAAYRESTDKFSSGNALQGELFINNKYIHLFNKNIHIH